MSPFENNSLSLRLGKKIAGELGKVSKIIRNRFSDKRSAGVETSGDSSGIDKGIADGSGTRIGNSRGIFNAVAKSLSEQARHWLSVLKNVWKPIHAAEKVGLEGHPVMSNDAHNFQGNGRYDPIRGRGASFSSSANSRAGANQGFRNQGSYNPDMRQGPYPFDGGGFGEAPSGTAVLIKQMLIAAVIAAIPISLYMGMDSDVDNLFEKAKSKVSKGATAVIEEGRQKLLDGDTQRVSKRLDSLKSNMPQKQQPSETVQSALKDTALEHAAKHSDPKYVCPMHPSVISDDPNAICPICGMDLVLLETGGDAGVVQLTSTVINSLGVRTAKVKRKTLYRRIDSVGYIDVDENNIRVVSLRTDGWIEHLAVKTAGERVTAGQLLFEVYSPTLVNAQDEYVQALDHANDLLLNASEERLRALGVSAEQIAELAQSRKVEQLVKVFAPQSGVVSQLNVREGQFIKPSQAVLDLVDLSSVWLMVDIFERQADWVELGQRAEATLPFMPGKSWEGKVEYIYPSLDASTRSLKVRLRFDNVSEDLKPNMYADVSIFAKPKKKVLAIPREALIRTGQEKRVVVAIGEGKYVPMMVQTGMETDDYIEISQGLGEGDEVVTSSQFLIDSESNLKASLAKMAGG